MLRLSHIVVLLTATVVMVVGVDAQTIYQGKDAGGKPVFTDQPRPGDKPVELPPVNTTPPERSLPHSTPLPAAFSGYAQVALSVAGSVPNSTIPVSVGIVIEPELQNGHLWQLSLDGVFVAAGREASYTFAHLERGQHTLSLRVVDSAGQTLVEASPAEVFVQFQGHRK